MYECLPVHYHVYSFDSHRVQRCDGRYCMSEANKAIYSRAWQELMNTRNPTIVDELFAPNYVRHDPHFPLRGREALKWFVTVLHKRSLHRGLNPYRDLAFFPPPKSVKRGLYAS